MQRVALHTVGCKLNEFETQAIRERFMQAGFRPVPFKDTADVYVVNTCAVTSRGAAQSRKLLRRARRRAPEAIVVAAGCCAEVEREHLAGLEEVDIVVGNRDKTRIPEKIQEHKHDDGSRKRDHDFVFEDFDVSDMAGHSRAFVKVQEGCESYCSYCIIPYARGRCRSREPASVLQQIRKLTDAGFREIVISGTHLGMYGVENDDCCGLTELVYRVCRETGVERIRLNSLEPLDLTDELFELIRAEPRICRHIHLPLQSGSDEILSWMQRPYRAEDIANRMRRLEKAVPGICIGTDVIAGFPGESLRHHEQTYRLLQDLPLGYLHVFPFSSRPGTPAAGFDGEVHPEEKKRRAEKLYALRRQKIDTYQRKFLGKEIPALIESNRQKNGQLTAMTDNYLRIFLDGPDAWKNRIMKVVPQTIDQTGALRGERAPD